MSYRNPSRRSCIIIVASLYGVLGILFGMMAGLLLGEVIVCAVLGGLAGALGGGVLEGRPFAKPEGKGNPVHTESRAGGPEDSRLPPSPRGR